MFDDLPSWLIHIEKLHPKTMDLGLERITKVAYRLQLLPFNCPVITVTGTNGKGSCVFLTEAILLAAGYKVGTYTSPHLLRYNERQRINGVEINDAELCRALTKVEQARQEISLSYFEFATLTALFLFKEAQLDAVILEVGIGGRLDAVNIVDPEVAIISTIALDHMETLGADRVAIGREKAGIMRPHKAVVCGDFDPPNSIYHFAEQTKALLFCQGQNFGYEDHGLDWSWWGHGVQYEHLPLPKIALQNAATILMAIQQLPPRLSVKRADIEHGLQQVFIPGRFQVIPGPVSSIFDVAHNPAAATLLVKQLQKTAIQGKTLAVVAMLNDKDRVGTVTALLSTVNTWYIGELAGPRGGEGGQLLDALQTLGAEVAGLFATVTVAYQKALTDAQLGDRIIIFGSFYTVAEAMQMRL